MFESQWFAAQMHRFQIVNSGTSGPFGKFCNLSARRKSHDPHCDWDSQQVALKISYTINRMAH